MGAGKLHPQMLRLTRKAHGDLLLERAVSRPVRVPSQRAAWPEKFDSPLDR